MPKLATIILTTTGTDTGPFNLLSDVDSFVTPFESNVPKSSLVVGYTTNLVPDAATIIRVKSNNGACTNHIDLVYPTTTTTSTTTTTTTPIPTTTTTTSTTTTTTTPSSTTTTSTTTTTTTPEPTTTSTTTTTTTAGSECIRIVTQAGIEEEFLNCGIYDRYNLYTAYYYVNCTASNAPQNIDVYFTASSNLGGDTIYTLTIPSGSHYGTENIYTLTWTGDCAIRQSETFTITVGPISPTYATCSCSTYDTDVFNISIGNTSGSGGTCDLARDTFVYSTAPSAIGSATYTFYTDPAMTIPFVGVSGDEYALSWAGAPSTVRVVEINGSGVVTNVSNCY